VSACGCGHAAHWRACQADVVGLLGTTFKCPCRHRGPSASPEEEAARLNALIERSANWLMQGRNGSDSEGEAAERAHLDRLKRQRAELVVDE
jgi:hypothetical protein